MIKKIAAALFAMALAASPARAGTSTIQVTPGTGATYQVITNGGGNFVGMFGLCDGVAAAQCVAVKAASTAAGATDPALVVAISPNNGVGQFGVWTVQPGNTANTTPWLFTISSGGVQSGAFAAGSIASGAAVSGAFAAGAIVDLAHGQAAMAGSVPVAIASNQTAVPVSAATLPLPANSAQETGGNLATLAGAITASVAQSNTKQVNGVTTLAGAGATGTGSQRVTAAQDTTTVAGSAPGTAGAPSANVMSVQGVGSGTAVPVSAASLPLPSGAATSANQPALGQTTRSASLPVTSATDPDIRPGAASTTVVDSGSTSTPGFNSVNVITGSPTAGSTVAQAINGQATVTATITAITGTLTFEVSNDGGTTWVAVTLRQRGGSGTSSTTTGLGVFDGDVTAKTNFRVRQTAAGAATATLTFSSLTNDVQVLNPLRLYDNGSNQVNSIKAASTPAAATDTAIVISPRPDGSQYFYNVQSSTLTRAPDSTTYTANTTVCLAKTVTSCAPLTIAVGSLNQGKGMINHVTMLKSGATTANALFTIWLYSAAPVVTTPNQFDNVAYLGPRAADMPNYIGNAVCSTPVATSDTSAQVWYDCTLSNPNTSGALVFQGLSGSTNINAIISVTAAYAPANGETFVVGVSGFY